MRCLSGSVVSVILLPSIGIVIVQRVCVMGKPYSGPSTRKKCSTIQEPHEGHPGMSRMKANVCMVAGHKCEVCQALL